MTISADFILTDAFMEARYAATHNLASNTLKAMLSSNVPNAKTTNLRASVTEIANGNGYTTGGVTLPVTSATQVNGIFRLVMASFPAITAAGAGFSFKALEVYNDTATGDPIIGFLVHSAVGAKTITNMEVAANVAILTCASHDYSVGNEVVVTQLPAAVLNRTATITEVTTDTFRYAVTTANIASQAVATGRVVKPETVTLAPGQSYGVTTNTTTGVIVDTTQGVTV
jgi:hypothetical protein